MTGERSFYDIHCHAFNLSHPNLLLFWRRLKPHLCSLEEIPANLKMFLAMLSGRHNNRMANLLAVMERDPAEYFLLLENELLKFREPSTGKLLIGGGRYDRVVLTPLMMDFGRRGRQNYAGIRYSPLSHKSIVEQVVDLFNGIRDYLEQSSARILDIYPFLGINTQNYELTGSGGKWHKLDRLLDKYFGPFTRSEAPADRRRKLREAMGRFTGDIATLPAYSFAGIKLYPPLGFDPWPELNPAELEKVQLLYRTCRDRRIPITTHCNDTGFVTEGQPDALTSPAHWRKVLDRDEFGDLTVNFAHFGYQEKRTAGVLRRTAWQEDLLKLMGERRNIYADFSFRGMDGGYYGELSRIIDRQADRDRFQDRVLFGSDFMIQLLAVDSYEEYLTLFSRTERLADAQKERFCSGNPERFLFGGSAAAY